MTKQTDKQAESHPRIIATDGNGKNSRLRAERLEIDFGAGRRLLFSFPETGWSNLEIEALTPGDEPVLPVIDVRPGAANHIQLRVDTHPDPSQAEAVDMLPGPPTLNLSVQKAVDGANRLNAPKKHHIRRWAQAAVLRNVEAVVRLVGEAEGRDLNKNYRGKDYATNVLTFTYDGKKKGGDMPLFGDLVLCVPVIVREAAEQGKVLDAHFAHLVVHGMLHLQGFNHENASDAEQMEAREREILRALGYADPYA